MKIRIAEPYGFCAGVRRAVEIVEKALIENEKLFLIHELVHNEQVTAELAARGVCSVSDLSAVPAGSVLIVSAHGAKPEIFAEAEKKKLTVIDATCPLVHQVQLKAKELTGRGTHVLLFGHKAHREVEGIVGYTAPGLCTVLESVQDVLDFVPEHGAKYATLSQTTLNEQEIAGMNDLLQKKIPDLLISGNVCRATGERQKAVRKLAEECDAMVIIGSKNSSNTMRLTEVARGKCARVYLVSSENDLPELSGVNVLGVSAGASAPDSLIQAVIRKLSGSAEQGCRPQ